MRVPIGKLDVNQIFADGRALWTVASREPNGDIYATCLSTLRRGTMTITSAFTRADRPPTVRVYSTGQTVVILDDQLLAELCRP